MKNKKIGLCITGSFCTFAKLLPEIRHLKENGNDLYPVFSYSVAQTDTRFYNAKQFFDDVTAICGREPVVTISGAEPFGPSKKMDLMIIAPCTGNTLAKLNHAITDTPVLMAVKAHLRNGRPVLIAVSTNDGLSNNARNIGDLMYKKNIFFVPFSQDNYADKESSLVAHYELLEEAAELAVEKKQLQPVIRSK
jgi:dipicolinate synthase subunit B